MSKAKVLPATSKDVRAFFTTHPDLVPAGAEISVKESQRGRIKPEAVAVFNKHSGKRYVEGTEATMPLTFKARNHREVTVHLPKSQVRSLAGKSGSRGPLSASDLAFAREVYASQK